MICKEKTYKNMKMSRYNMYVKDEEGNLLVYNFLNGMNSLSKISKKDISQFEKMICKITDIDTEDRDDIKEMVRVLRKKGIVVDENIDEEVTNVARTYEETYDNDLYLTILTTGKCNFKCSYCLEANQDFSRNRLDKPAQDAIVRFIQMNLHKYNGIHISWFGGEPLLEMSVIDNLSNKIDRLCSSRYIPYSAQTTTNGYLLNEENLKKLYDLKVYNYMITVDGFKEQHDKCRCLKNGKGTYDTIFQNLLDIRNNPNYRFLHITIRVNVTKEILDTIDELIEYLDSMFSDDPRFQLLFVPVADYSKDSSSKCADYITPNELSERLSNNKLYVDKYKPQEMETYLINPGRGCVAGLKNSLVITPDLKVYKCCAHYDMPDNYLGYIDLGGRLMLDESQNQKWYLMKETIRKKDKSCKECFYYPACMKVGKGCPYNYFHDKPLEETCPIREEGYIKELENEIIKAATTYPCYVAYLNN